MEKQIIETATVCRHQKPMNWNNKPWHSLDYELKHRFGTKVYKIALDGGMTCPNRDGSLGTRGCIFCSAGGSGDFAVPFGTPLAGSQTADKDSRPLEVSIQNQIDAGAARIRHKLGSSPEAYIAYFQSYTNTYAPVAYLEELFTAAIRHPLVRVLSIATRPDCLSGEVVHLLSRLNQIKPVWIELGLQTIHEDTAAYIHRGYPLPCFEDALKRLRAHHLETIVHVILGLPGESREKMLGTIRYLAGQDIQGVKLQLLHILKGTDLADIHARCPLPLPSMEEYLDLVIDCVALLPPRVVIHRLTGDGPKSLLIAPLWSANKRLVLGSLDRRFRERSITQGCRWPG